VEELPKVEIVDKEASTKDPKDLKMEAMHRIKDELNEDKEKNSKLQKDSNELKSDLLNKGDQMCKVKSLNESLINKVKNLKKVSNSNGKLENFELKEELKNKDEKIRRLCKHNQELINDVKKVRRHLHESKSKNRDEDISTKIEECIIKKLKRKFARRLKNS